MKPLKSILLIIALFIVSGISNAQDSEDINEAIIGKWEYKSVKTEFMVDGKDDHDLLKFIEKMLDDDKYIFQFRHGNRLFIDDDLYEYTIEDDIISITPEDDEDLTIRFRIEIQNNILFLHADKMLTWFIIQESEDDIDIGGTPLSLIVDKDDVKMGFTLQFSKR